VIEDAASPEAYVAKAYADAGVDVKSAVRPSAPAQINGQAALRLERDLVVGDADKLTTLIAGNGVIYRVNLFGGGDGGPEEPESAAVTLYEQIVRSFRVLATPLKPKAIAQRSVAPAGVDAAQADIFNYPLRSGQGVNYGVPAGLISANTHIEWLGYGVRNLDLWGVKCYGVEWSRMLHTGEDWYRLDGASTAGAPVYAVANGVVAKHNPGINYPGNVVIIRHRLADGRDIYSMYGHVTNVKVVEGQTVTLGQQIASVFNQGYTGRTPSQHPTYDAHLHFEMRWFLDGTNIYVPGTNLYNYNYPGCTYAYPGRGYTYLIHPDNYPYPSKGYTEPSTFIAAHLGTAPTPTNTPAPTLTPAPTVTPAPTLTPTPLPQTCDYVRDGNFEDGLPTTNWAATNSQNKTDPLIYKDRPHAGAWGAWFGNVLNYTDTLKQIITLPTDRSGARLRFWRYIRSNEAATSDKDLLRVLLIAADGSERVVSTISTAVTRNQWVQETVPLDLHGVSAANITLAFRGINNSTLVSSFFVDDVALTMPCGVGAQAVEQPVAQPIAVAAADDATAANVVCSNLARDGNFEAGKLGIGWAAISNTSGKLYSDPAIYTVRPHAGSYGAWLGANNLNSVWNELVQTIQLPPRVTSVQVRFWRYLETAETDRAKVYDVFTAGLETEKGIQIVTPLQIDNTSTGRNIWSQQTLDLPNAANYANQKLWVSFKATTDSNLPSSLYVDDVEINVCVAQ
ncbi:MAG: M23 family metallopeptidase, partial [Chloroflexi bacterium]|nr:M23 family metallopeptidase [Chloroflexota bacterium]